MFSYHFNLSQDQPVNKEALMQLQTYLAAFDVFLDLSWEEGNSRMSIFISDEALEKGATQCAEQSQSGQNDEPDPEPVPDTPVKRRGRPAAKPINDVSLGHVYHMRFMGVPAETIAEEIGVSRRTLFRRLADVNGKDISPDTPFSQWNC
jgi:hypothetical protein